MARRQSKSAARPGPSRSPPALRVAHQLWAQQRFDEALRKFNEALRQAPSDLATLLEAGRAFGARYQIERSEALLEKAVRLGSRRPDVLFLAGESYRRLGRMAQAETCFRRACRLKADPTAQLELARICERRHRLDEAEDLIHRVLESVPDAPVAWLLRARIQRRRNETERAEETLRQLIARAPDRGETIAEAFGELAQLLDQHGDYDGAWEAILQCKRIMLTRDAADWQAAEFVLTRFRRSVDQLTPDHFSRWSGVRPDNQQQRVALLTGFPRSGTTLLEQVLDAHPEVVSSEEKDVFSRDVFVRLANGYAADAAVEQVLDELSPDTIHQERASYLATMEAMLGEPIGTRWHLDKNPPMNLMIPVMLRIFPELKLLVALRDPRDVVLSCFLRYLPLNPVSVCFLTLERAADRYLLDMSAWLKLREMIQADWAEIRYENAVSDLRGEAQRALGVLDLPWDDRILNYRERVPAKQILSPTYDAVAKPIFTTSIGRWRNYQRHLAPVLDRLLPILPTLGYEA